MKTRPFLVAALVATAALVSSSRSAEKKPPPEIAGPRVQDAKFEFVAGNAPDVAEVRGIGERAINRLAYSMVTEAASAVAKQGEAEAIGVCHLKHVRLDGGVIADMPRVVAWKRTSLKIRDAANAPDPADVAALNRVLADLNAGNLPPKLFVQRLDYPAGPPEWRVYKPVAVLNQCLPCHGPAENLSADVAAELKRRYPGDSATGYQAGEWRGLIRVSIGPPPASAPVPPATPAAKAPAASPKRR